MFFLPHLPSLESHRVGSVCARLHLKFPRVFLFSQCVTNLQMFPIFFVHSLTCDCKDSGLFQPFQRSHLLQALIYLVKSLTSFLVLNLIVFIIVSIPNMQKQFLKLFSSILLNTLV